MLTLNDVKVGKRDKVDQMIIDTFIRNSAILAQMPFDDSQSAGTGGSTLTYGYMQLLTPSGATTRDINDPYVNAEAKKKELQTRLKIMGGSYKIDRVLDEAQPAEVAFQAEQKIKATVNLFTNLFINGNATANPKDFDGLSTLLTGSATELTSGADLSDTTETVMKSNAVKLCEEIDTIIAGMSEKPDLIIANSKAIIKIRSAARVLGYLTATEDAFGKTTQGYNGIPFMPVDDYVTAEGDDVTSTAIIPVVDGKTDIYFVKFGRAAVHGVTIKGDKVITSRLPDFKTAGTVKEGDVEFVVGVALKNTRGAGVLRGVTITA